MLLQLTMLLHFWGKGAAVFSGGPEVLSPCNMYHATPPDCSCAMLQFLHCWEKVLQFVRGLDLLCSAFTMQLLSCYSTELLPSDAAVLPLFWEKVLQFFSGDFNFLCSAFIIQYFCHDTPIVTPKGVLLLAMCHASATHEDP